jgi:hypothetical protein
MKITAPILFFFQIFSPAQTTPTDINGLASCPAPLETARSVDA